MQLIAKGKWSKADKEWKMVVALRRPATSTSRTPLVQPGNRKGLRPQPRNTPER